MKSGFVGIIGRPNVGKSTLLNCIMNKKIAITSNVSNTTRNNIQGIYTNEDTQIVFVDTPGIHKPIQKLGRYLNKYAYNSIEDVDVLLLVVDVLNDIGSGDNFVFDKLENVNKPIILIINKIDKIKREELFPIIEKYNNKFNFNEIVPVSSMKNINIDRLLEVIKKYLPDTIKYYDDKFITTSPLKFTLSEFIREKVLQLTKEEVPHSTACVIEKMEETDKSYIINACIIVDRDSLKKIIIGKQGSMIKEIGIRARSDIEEYLDKKVFLDLYVKTIKNWRDREKDLLELGLIENE